uniref:CSON012335 protein n=1 Tax=Culicoides sonorensis TaxID=179676 RepID=A0A336KJC5_CULSO
MDQTRELDVALYYVQKSKKIQHNAFNENEDGSENKEKKNLIKSTSIKAKPRRKCSVKPFFKFLLRVGVIVAIGGMFYWTFDVSKTMVYSFWERPDSFTVDTLNLHWNTTFPGITVCQVFNGERNWELSEKYYGEDRDKRLDDFIIDITYFSGTCYSCELCQQDLECPKNFSELLSKFRSVCSNMITNCTWNGIEFDCCKMFLPLETEFGTCYTINSINTKPSASRVLVSNRKTGPGRLEFALLEDVQIFIHPSNEVPHAFQDRELKQTVLWGSKKEIILKTDDIIDPEKSSVSCFKPKGKHINLFPTGFNLYEAYTASTCAIACHIQAQIYYCNCTHHFMPHSVDSKCIYLMSQQQIKVLYYIA